MVNYAKLRDPNAEFTMRDLSSVELVSSSVGELTRLQEDGFSYIRL